MEEARIDDVLCAIISRCKQNIVKNGTDGLHIFHYDTKDAFFSDAKSPPHKLPKGRYVWAPVMYQEFIREGRLDAQAVHNKYVVYLTIEGDDPLRQITTISHDYMEHDIPQQVENLFVFTVNSSSGCALCGKHNAPLRKCGGCELIRYCSPECQKTHWKEVHKAECKAVQAFKQQSS